MDELERGQAQILAQVHDLASQYGISLKEVKWVGFYCTTRTEVHTLKVVGPGATWRVQLEREWIAEHVKATVPEVEAAIRTAVQVVG